MDTFDIVYRVTNHQIDWEYKLELHPDSLDIMSEPLEDLPDWTSLGFEQCSHCPLSTEDFEHCPLAMRLADLLERCYDMVSFTQVRVAVQTPSRTILRDTSAQRAIGSLMGLIMAVGGCPYTRFFRPMARFHLPFADETETSYRAVANYLTMQYFRYQEGHQPDLELTGLRRIYERIHTMNVDFSRRLQAAVDRDSSMNALVFLDVLAQTMTYMIEDSLSDLRGLFDWGALRHG